ncbi:MAG TPA: hypothetical protein VK447_21535 [Myxococcaceae bacterium]|nr:hypothetical protein [Myxococcaceae bacterium]
MDVAFTGWRQGLQKDALVQAIRSETRLSTEKAAETVDKILAIPTERVEVLTPENAQAVVAGAERLGVAAWAEGAAVTIAGWRLGLGERRFVEMLEELGDVPPTLARAVTHRLAEGPVVLVDCGNGYRANQLVQKAAPLGVICRLAEASIWDFD